MCHNGYDEHVTFCINFNNKIFNLINSILETKITDTKSLIQITYKFINRSIFEQIFLELINNNNIYNKSLLNWLFFNKLFPRSFSSLY